MTRKNKAPKVAEQKIALERILAIVLAVVGVVALFLPYNTIAGKDGNYSASSSMLFLALTGNSGNPGLLATLSAVIMLATSVAAVVFAVLAFLKEEKQNSFVRLSALLLSTGAGVYSASVFALSTYIDSVGATFDFLSLLIALVGIGLYIFFAFKANGKAVVKPLLYYAASLLATLFLLCSVAVAGKASLIPLVVLALAFVCLVLATLRLQAAKNSFLDKSERIRLIVQLAIALVFALLAIIMMGGKSFLFALIAVAIAAVPVAENFFNMDEEDGDSEESEYIYSEYSDNEEEEYDENEPELEMFPSIPKPKTVVQEESLAGYRIEEYAEACAYDGGPVAGVEFAEEVNPTFMQGAGQVSTGGYDFYNCHSFDPFIATLSTEERNQFTEIFILKYRGTMPEIPDYVVGGDNREFFRKIFIYLGQYRERIPNGLLGKIYAFSTKIS